MFYTLINYFDVWGNAADGFEVNNQCIECDDLFIDDSATNKDVVVYLKKAGYLLTDDLRRVSVVDFGGYMEVQKKSGHPLFGLMPNN